jgi:hypothetical protein
MHYKASSKYFTQVRITFPFFVTNIKAGHRLSLIPFFFLFFIFFPFLFSSSYFFFFFLRRYNFREVLAFSTNFFHLVRFLMPSFQFVIFILVISLFTSSSHLLLGIPSDLVSAGDHSYTFFTVLLSGI